MLQPSYHLRERYREASAFWLAAHALTPRFRKDVLFGARIAPPIRAAMLTERKLGLCNHVLDQMIVAGTMTVFPPMQVRVSPPPPSSPSPEQESSDA